MEPGRARCAGYSPPRRRAAAPRRVHEALHREVALLRDFTAAQIALAVLGIGLLIAWHELGHYLVARLTGMRVVRYSLGLGPKLVSFRQGGIQYQLAAVPFGGFVQIAGMTPFEQGAREDPRSFINAPRWARIAVLLAGPGFNYLLAFALFLSFHLGWPGVVGRVTAVTPESPAARAGLRVGDLVHQVDGKSSRTARQLEERLMAGGKIEVRLVREAEGGVEEQRLELEAGARPSLTGLGLTLSMTDIERHPLEALSRSLDACWRNTVGTLAAIARLIEGDPEVSASGPLAIVVELKERAKRSAPDFVWLLAVLSVSLGLFNLLPVPALDGIKVLFLTVEAAARRELSPVLQLWINGVGFLALIVLMGVLTVGELKDLLSG